MNAEDPSTTKLLATMYSGPESFGVYKYMIQNYALKKGSLHILDGQKEADIPAGSTPAQIETIRKEFSRLNNDLYFQIAQTITDKSGYIDLPIGDVAALWGRVLAENQSGSQASIKHMVKKLITTEQGTRSVITFMADVSAQTTAIESALKSAVGCASNYGPD